MPFLPCLPWQPALLLVALLMVLLLPLPTAAVEFAYGNANRTVAATKAVSTLERGKSCGEGPETWWVLLNASDGQVTVTLTQLSTTHLNENAGNGLRVYDGVSTSNKSLAFWSGNLSDQKFTTVTSSSATMLLVWDVSEGCTGMEIIGMSYSCVGCGACQALYTTTPPYPIGNIASSSASALQTLADSMSSASTVGCVVAKVPVEYITVSSSPNYVVEKNGEAYAQIVSYGGNTHLCVFVAWEPNVKSLKDLGLKPSLAAGHAMAFLFNVDRLTQTGELTNSDPFIVDIEVTDTIVLVLIFEASYPEGRTLEEEGGWFEASPKNKSRVRLHLKHTSAIAGYTSDKGKGSDNSGSSGSSSDSSSSSGGSSEGLYGLLALIAIPVLICICLLGAAWWYYNRQPVALVKFEPHPALYPMVQTAMPSAAVTPRAAYASYSGSLYNTAPNFASCSEVATYPSPTTSFYAPSLV